MLRQPLKGDQLPLLVTTPGTEQIASGGFEMVKDRSESIADPAVQQIQILIGDSAQVLRSLPEDSFACCFTSPPYYGLLDYGFEGQIGLEATPDAYLEALQAVFEQIYRVLIPGSCCFVVIGDTSNNYSPVRSKDQRREKKTGDWAYRRSLVSGYREKELLGIPQRFTEMMRSLGFLHRFTYIWDKGGSVPSQSDASNASHEFTLQFIKHSGGRCYANFSAGDLPSVIHLRSQRHSAHPCPFPVELAQRFLSGLKVKGLILDPFAGIGSTLKAAQSLGFAGIGIEGNPNFAQIASAEVREQLSSDCSLTFDSRGVREQESDICSLTDGGGTVEIKTIKGRQYRYLRFRQGGKLKSKYLGKVSAS